MTTPWQIYIEKLDSKIGIFGWKMSTLIGAIAMNLLIKLSMENLSIFDTFMGCDTIKEH